MLEPLLNRPDDGGGDLAPADCAVLLLRLEAIADQWEREDDDTLLHQHIEYARQLAGVLRLCVEKDVPLLFL